MTQEKNQINQYAGISFSDVSCIIEPLIVAQHEHIAAVVDRMTTPTAQFVVMHLVDQVKLTGVGMVEAKYGKVLKAIATDPRPKAVVGEPEKQFAKDIAPILRVMMMMFEHGGITPQSSINQMLVFGTKVTQQ